MLTTKRSNENGLYSSEKINSGIDLLERKIPESYAEFQGAEKTEEKETLEQAKVRMQKNLEYIMNFNSTNNSNVATVDRVDNREVVNYQDEDINPTSTTLQFGNGNNSEVYNDLEKREKEEQTSYHLNGKGKLLIALYAVAVTVILALIVLNTGVLSALRSDNTAKIETLNAKVQEFSSLSNEINTVSSNDYVINVAENDFGMVKGN